MGNLGGSFGVSGFGAAAAAASSAGQQNLGTRGQFPSISVPQQQQEPFSSFSSGFAAGSAAPAPNAFPNQQQALAQVSCTRLYDPEMMPRGLSIFPGRTTT